MREKLRLPAPPCSRNEDNHAVLVVGVRESLATKIRNAFEGKFTKATASLKLSIEQNEQRRNENMLRLKR